MDYSAASADTEALHGSSPWGSSSPRADRSTFVPSEPNVPSSPGLPPPAGHSHSNSQDSISANPFANEAGSAPRSQPAEPPAQPSSSDVEEQQPTKQPAQPGQARQESLRAGARQQSMRQHRTVPAYKLQAKVTALERTGRKDPVIRFDIYVCPRIPYLLPNADILRPTSPSFAPLNSAT